MTKNFFIFLVLILFVSAAGWLLFKKKDQAGQGSLLESSSVSPSPSSGTAAPTAMADGLQVQDEVIGTGAEAKNGMLVTVHYTGTFTNGTKFDSSLDRGQPFQFILGGGMVIKGWDEGLLGMKVGGKRKLVIPPQLGYGAQANGPIPANSTLVFEVQLLDVKAGQ